VARLWYTDLVSDPSATDLNPVWGVLMFFPFFNFTKFILDVLAVVSTAVDRTTSPCSLKPGSTFGNDQLYQVQGAFDGVKPPVPAESLWLLFMNAVFWFLLTLYFDQVIPNDNGMGQHPLFFLFPSYWNPEKLKITQSDDEPTSVLGVGEDADVVKERQDAKPVEGDQMGLRITGLMKRYDAGFNSFISWIGMVFNIAPKTLNSWFGWYAHRPAAVQELSLVVARGTLLSLLGSNGGKFIMWC
jgi:hypothetical protein